VAALSGALGAALVSEEISNVLKKSESLRKTFAELIDKDTEVFNKVMEAYGLPKDTDVQKDERRKAIEEATKQATAVPLEVIRNCLRALELTRVVAQKGNRNSISDAGVAALILKTASDGAALNVRINLNSINDKNFEAQVLKEMQSMTAVIQALTEDTLRIVNSVIKL